MLSLTKQLDQLAGQYRLSSTLRRTVYKSILYVNLYDFGLALGLGDPMQYVLDHSDLYPISAKGSEGIEVLVQQASGFERMFEEESGAFDRTEDYWIRASFAVKAMGAFETESDLSKHLLAQLERYDFVVTNSNRIEVLVPNALPKLSYVTFAEWLTLTDTSDVLVLRRKWIQGIAEMCEKELSEEVNISFDKSDLIYSFRVKGIGKYNFYRG